MGAGFIDVTEQDVLPSGVRRHDVKNEDEESNEG